MIFLAGAPWELEQFGTDDGGPALTHPCSRLLLATLQGPVGQQLLRNRTNRK